MPPWAAGRSSGDHRAHRRREEEGQALNRDYRDKDYATNVLSFPYETAEPLPKRRLLGDLVLFARSCCVKPPSRARLLEAHYAHLIGAWYAAFAGFRP
jgi:probable rRNA maturation factor